MNPEDAAMDDMDDEYAHMIPAASIGDIDLNALGRTNPAAAKEIAHLDALMNRGEESKEQFLRLCQSLFDVGAVDDSEYLLRRNLDSYEGEILYKRLFGTAKRDEFNTAIAAFESQFGAVLNFVEKHDFLVCTFHSGCGPLRNDNFRMLSQPCEVKIGYSEKDKIDADIMFLEPVREGFDESEYLLLYYVNGVWELTDA